MGDGISSRALEVEDDNFRGRFQVERDCDYDCLKACGNDEIPERAMADLICNFMYLNPRPAGINHTRLQLLVNEQASHSLSSTNTHTSQKNLLLLSPALAQPSNNLSGTSSTQWVAECDGSTSGVHLLVWQLEHVFAIDSHGGKGLVDFDDITVVDGDVVFGEQLGDGD